jgi:hypothetical protein
MGYRSAHQPQHTYPHGQEAQRDVPTLRGLTHTRGRAGQSRSGRRLGRLMARNDPAINGRNRICCNNIARFRTTPAAGRRVSRPPVTTSTRARAAKQQIVPTRCGHPGSAISTIRSRRAQPGPLNLHEYRHCAGRRRWPGMRRHGRRPELRRSGLSGARSVATTRATRGCPFSRWQYRLHWPELVHAAQRHRLARPHADERRTASCQRASSKLRRESSMAGRHSAARCQFRRNTAISGQYAALSPAA